MRPGRPRIWTGLKLDRLKVDYEADAEALKVLALKHAVHTAHISRLARRHGWKARHGKWAMVPTPPILVYIEQSTRGEQA